MRNIRMTFLIIALASIFSLNTGQAYAALPSVVKSKCTVCHSFEKGAKHKTGPNLHGIVGKKAGTSEGYRYGASLREASFIWTLDKLRLWLADSKKAIRELTHNPDAKTKMPVQRLSGAKLDAVIAYLESISPKARMAKMSKTMNTMAVAPKAAAKSDVFHAAPKPVAKAMPAPTAAPVPTAPASSPTLKRSGHEVLAKMEVRAKVERRTKTPSRSIASVQPIMAEPKGDPAADLLPAATGVMESMPAAPNGHEDTRVRVGARASSASSTALEDNKFAEVDQILANLPDGNIAFNSPETMNLEETAMIQLILSMQKTVEELKEAVTAAGKKQGAIIKVSRLMEARLSGVNFQIAAISPEEQRISSELPTVWKWDVKPTSKGSHQLHLTLNLMFENGPKRFLRSFDKIIKVEVPPGQQIGGFVENNWKWLWTVIFVPLAGWGWRRYKTKEATTG